MSRNLCISVTLLDPLFHGNGDRGEPEWPPSPMRLFQALVAGSRSGCRYANWSDAKGDAFRWLERREAPLIIAPASHPAAAYKLFVPNNDSDTKPERQNRLTEKNVRPQHILEPEPGGGVGLTLHYVWAIPEEEWEKAQPQVEVLRTESRCLTALGWGIDQAVADGRVLTNEEVEALLGRRWRPWDAPFPGRPRLRVPVEGTLDDLERSYEAFRKRLSMRQPPKAREPRVFDTKVYLPVGALPPRPYAAFELPEGVAFRQEDAVFVAAMLRSVACSCAKRDTHVFPGGPELYVAGHTRDDTTLRNGPTPPRFSYITLPTIGHQHADGMIRRVLIAEPFGGDGSHARWAQQRLRNQVLRDRDGNERGVLHDLWRAASERIMQRYVGESQTWSTVTPVILPGFDDGKRAKAERLFLRALEQAGLPFNALTDFTLRKAPFQVGLHPNQYRRPDYLDSGQSRRFSAWHVHVSFHDAIAGPITIGAGRHVGLGLFAMAE